jgi:hypothetical protein
MALNFPNSPTIGDEFTGGGFTWTWTGSAWEKVEPASDGAEALNNFSCFFNSMSDNTFALPRNYPAGRYNFSLNVSDTSYDIYLVDENNALVGYANASSSTTIVASNPFNSVVILGAPITQRVEFVYAGLVRNPSSSGQFSAAGPYISSVSPSDMPNINSSSIISGGNFGSNTSIVLTDKNGATLSPKSITLLSSTQILFVRPDVMLENNAPYDLKVINSGVTVSSGVDTLVDGITAGGDPQWITPAMLAAAVPNVASTWTVQATDPNGSTITYAAVSLPAGFAFNPSTRTISGTPTTTGNLNVEISATDAEGNVTNRTFVVPVPATTASYIGKFSTTFAQSINNIAIDSLGTTYVTGQYRTSADPGQGIFMKINRDGTLAWQRITPTYQASEAVGIYLTDTGLEAPVFLHRTSSEIKYFNQDGTVAASRIFSHTGWPLDTTTLSNNEVVLCGSVGNGPDYWGYVAKVSANRNTGNFIQWEPGYGEFRSVTSDSSNNIIAAGSSSRFIGGSTNGGYLVKFNSSLGLVWQKSFNNSTFVLFGVDTDSSGNIYTSGYFTVSSVNRGYVAKFNANGDLQWQKTILVDNGTILTRLVSDDSGNVYIAGDFTPTTGGTRPLVVKMDTAGNLVWCRQFASSNNGNFRAVDLSPSGEIVLGGFSRNANGDKALMVKLLESTALTTYSLSGITYTYGAKTATVDNATITVANGTGTVTNKESWSFGSSSNNTSAGDLDYASITLNRS